MRIINYYVVDLVTIKHSMQYEASITIQHPIMVPAW